MCRHLGWLGSPVPVSSLVLDPPSGLRVQSYAPRRQKHGLVNADGWGVGFFDAAGGPPRRWRSAAPIWGDASFASVSPALSSGCVVAAVRSATVGMPIDASATAPFTDGRWLLSHNGVVDRTVLPPGAQAESVVDSALLAALIFERGLDTLGDTLSILRRSDGTVLASEPYDDHPDWRDVPDRHLIEVSGDHVTLTPLS
jgi:glutamine amidotransferase